MRNVMLEGYSILDTGLSDVQCHTQKSVKWKYLFIRTIEFWEQLENSIAHSMMNVLTYPSHN